MMILINNEQDFPVDLDKLRHNAQTILNRLEYADFDLGILLARPSVMQEYNKKYRNKDKVTDVISFPFHHLKAGEHIVVTSEDEKNLGDIIICPQYVHDDLDRWENSFQERMDILLVHGICHLLGYDHIDDDDYEVMKHKENELLAGIKK